jgi:hypothetical protein
MGLNGPERELGAADAVGVGDAPVAAEFSALLVRKNTGERATSMASR